MRPSNTTKAIVLSVLIAMGTAVSSRVDDSGVKIPVHVQIKAASLVTQTVLGAQNLDL